MSAFPFPADTTIITVSGMFPGIGKTLLSEYIIAQCPGIAAVKVTTGDYGTCVTDDESVIMTEGKDTWRYKGRGAGHTVWVRSHKNELERALEQALKLLAGETWILIEGNSVLYHIRPGLSLFVCDDRTARKADLKPSRVDAMGAADAIIINTRRSSSATDRQLVNDMCRSINKKATITRVDLSDDVAAKAAIQGLMQQHLPKAHMS